MHPPSEPCPSISYALVIARTAAPFQLGPTPAFLGNTPPSNFSVLLPSIERGTTTDTAEVSTPSCQEKTLTSARVFPQGHPRRDTPWLERVSGVHTAQRNNARGQCACQVFRYRQDSRVPSAEKQKKCFQEPRETLRINREGASSRGDLTRRRDTASGNRLIFGDAYMCGRGVPRSGPRRGEDREGKK